MMNKKGFTSLMLLVFIFFCFVLLIILGVAIFGLNTMDDVFRSIDVDVGDQNFSGVYNATTGQGVIAFNNMANDMALGLIVGFMFVMMMIGYYWGDINKRFWIILDILIIIVVEIIAIYLQVFFNDVMNLSFFGTTFDDHLNQSSQLMLNLPLIIPIIGAIIMIVTYGLASKKADQSAFGDL